MYTECKCQTKLFISETVDLLAKTKFWHMQTCIRFEHHYGHHLICVGCRRIAVPFFIPQMNVGIESFAEMLPNYQHYLCFTVHTVMKGRKEIIMKFIFSKLSLGQLIRTLSNSDNQSRYLFCESSRIFFSLDSHPFYPHIVG